VPQLGELGLATDERRLEAAGDRRHVLEDLHEPPGRHAVRLAGEVELAHRLHAHGVSDEAQGGVADEDLAGVGRLLETGGDVDRVPRDERLPGRRIAGDHLAHVDAAAQGDADPQLLLEPVVQAVDRLVELGDRAHGAKRVVLVHRRDAEDGHDGVADELLDGAAVPLQRLAGGLEVPGHHAAKRLRVELAAEPGGLGDVGEDNRDDLPRFAGA
jgi:hypothetical protein